MIGVVGNCSACPIVYNVFERLKEEFWHGPDSEWLDEELGEEPDRFDQP